jgi:FixJ family two-component response regulator
MLSAYYVVLDVCKWMASRRSRALTDARYDLEPRRSLALHDVTSSIIHVVDDDASFRTAIARLLRAYGYQVALYESGKQLLENPPGNEPGCILLDMQMSGLSGLELQDRLSQLKSILPIVFLSGHGSIPASVQAIKAGAEDFLSKPVAKEALFEAVGRALARHREARRREDQIDALRTLVATLTPREYEVFSLVIRGKLNKQIAYELGTSERTIKAHRHQVMHKLNVTTVAQLVSLAERLAPRDGMSP